MRRYHAVASLLLVTAAIVLAVGHDEQGQQAVQAPRGLLAVEKLLTTPAALASVNERSTGRKINTSRTYGKRHHKKKPPPVYTWYTATASVYDQWSGQVACGFRAGGGMGVAHKTMPCGTRIRFRYHGREVTATVIDRGPYIGGREWDLSYEVMHALGFPYGVDQLDWRYR